MRQKNMGQEAGYSLNLIKILYFRRQGTEDYIWIHNDRNNNGKFLKRTENYVYTIIWGITGQSSPDLLKWSHRELQSNKIGHYGIRVSEKYSFLTPLNLYAIF